MMIHGVRDQAMSGNLGIVEKQAIGHRACAPDHLQPVAAAGVWDEIRAFVDISRNARWRLRNERPVRIPKEIIIRLRSAGPLLTPVRARVRRQIPGKIAGLVVLLKIGIVRENRARRIGGRGAIERFAGPAVVPEKIFVDRPVTYVLDVYATAVATAPGKTRRRFFEKPAVTAAPSSPASARRK